LQAIAKENFVECRRPGRGGSHVIFSAPGVRQFVALIDAAGGIGKK
jgi:hypothetical protein